MLPRCVLLITFVLSFGSLASGQEQPVNLVQNPSLEGALTDTGLPDGWRAWWYKGTAFKASIVPGGHTGEKALLIEQTGRLGGVTTTKAPVQANKRYRARGWVKLEGEPGCKARVTLDFMRANGDYLYGACLSEVTAGETGWRCIAAVAHTADVPEAERVGVVVCVVGSGKAWFDDLELVAEEMPESGGNLVTNGSMEELAGDRPAYWSLSTAPNVVVALGSSEEAPKEGRRSLCLKGKAPYAVAVGERYRVEPGKTFTASGFVRVKSGQASVKIDYYQGGQYLGCTEAAPVSTNTWSERAVVSDFAKYPNATHFAASLVAFGGNLEACFDDVRLTVK